MKKLISLLVVLAAGIALFGAVTSAHATKIEYSASGSGPYTLDFTVTNDTLSSSINWLSVYFGVKGPGMNFSNTSAFSNFIPDDSGVPNPTGWFSYSFEPTAIDNPGIFNSDATGSGIDVGGSQAGFQVSFNKTSGTYDHLYFQVGDFDQSGGYNILDEGYTTLLNNGGPNVVPEPSTMLLLGAGLAGLAIYRRKRT